MKCKLLLVTLFVITSASTVRAQLNQADLSHNLPGQPATSQIAPPATGPHGGAVKQAGLLQIETVVSQSGIQMFVYDRNGQPASVDRGRGAATLRVEGSAKRYRYDLLPDGKGGLTAPVDLAQIAGRQIEVEIRLVGIAVARGQALTLSEVATVPASEAQLSAAAIARQKNCPVSGKPLGSMGDPIKVTIGEKPIFLCCKGCIKTIEADPAKYLSNVYGGGSAGSVPAGTEPVRAGIFKVSAEDAPFIAAQKNCPVMDEPLDAMGGPYKVHAAGRAIYICCPGCAKRIEAEPQKWLAVLAEQGVNAPTLR